MVERRPVTYRTWELWLVLLAAFLLTGITLWSRVGQNVTVQGSPLIDWDWPAPDLYDGLFLGIFIFWIVMCTVGLGLRKARMGGLAYGLWFGPVMATLLVSCIYNACPFMERDARYLAGFPVTLLVDCGRINTPGIVCSFIFWALVLTAVSCAVAFVISRSWKRPRNT